MQNQYDMLYEIAAGRKSVRDFDPGRDVSPEMVNQIIELARTSPYASGKKNWDIKVIRGEKQKQVLVQIIKEGIEGLQARMRDDFHEHFENYAKNFLIFESAPVILVPTFRVAPSVTLMCGGEDPELYQWERDNFVKSISCVSMLILLAAQSLGLGTCYLTGPLLAEKQLRGIIAPKPGMELAALIPVGYAAEK